MRADCHMHMILDGVYYRAAIDAQRNRPDEALIRARLEAYRAAGIRFLRDGGDAWGVGAFAAKLAPEYGIDYRTPIFPIHKKGHYGAFIGRGWDSLREYAALVAEARNAGADFIKIMISGLMDFDHYGVITSEPLPAAEIAELIRIAHAEGLSVMAHANGAETVRAAAEAGVDSVEHGAYLDAAALRAMADAGTIWVPTISTIGNLIGEGRYPDAVLKPLFKLQAENIRSFAKMGGTIAPGSDAGAYAVPHVQGALDEYKYLTEILGEGAETVLEAGAREIMRRFQTGKEGGPGGAD